LVEKVKELQHLVVSEVRQKKALQVVEQELSAAVRKKHRRFRCCCCNGLMIAIFILLLAMGYQCWQLLAVKQLTAQLKETQSQLKLLQNMPLFERVFR